MKRPVDPGEPKYPNVQGVVDCLHNCDEDLITEARFVEWQGWTIEQLTAHINWLRETLRDNKLCVDGGTCHHMCDPKGNCFRERGCLPLTGSKLNDDWTLPGTK